MVREERYIVLKGKDVESGLTETEQAILLFLCRKVESHREEVGKQPLKAVIVESDWPEYEKVWELLETRVDAESKAETKRQDELSLMLVRAVNNGLMYRYRFTEGQYSGLEVASNAHSVNRLTKYMGYKVMPLMTSVGCGWTRGEIFDSGKLFGVHANDVECVR